MLRDFKFIIKRIIIGVGIALLLSFLRGKLLLQTYAESYNYVPNDIIIASDYNTQYSTTTYTWWNDTYYGFPSTTPTDWPPAYTNIYFRYPQFNGSTLCSSTSNNGSISGVLANGSMNIDTTPYVRFEDTLNTVYTSCASSYSGQLLTFTCNNVNLSHGINIVVSNPNPGVWAIKRQLNINCSMTNEGLAQNANQNAQNIINNQNQNAQNIINNQNQNTQDITDNQNQNTQDIIDNQNKNTQDTIDSQKVCKIFSSSDIALNNRYLNSDGSISTNNNYGISDYLKINDKEITIITRFNNSSRYFCWYGEDKSLISCSASNTLLNNTNLTIPDNAFYIRFTFYKSSNVPRFKICSNGNQALNDTLTDDNVSSSTGSSFFNDFQSDSHGLSGIITSPLRLVQSLSSSTCSPLIIPLPFVSNNATIPCMSTIYNQFPSFYSLWQLITTGLIAYWVLIKIFGHIKGMQSPTDDRIEVFNL